MSSGLWTALSPFPSSFAVTTSFVTDTDVHVKRFHRHAKFSRWRDRDPTSHAFLMAGCGSVSGSFAHEQTMFIRGLQDIRFDFPEIAGEAKILRCLNERRIMANGERFSSPNHPFWI
jgi:hypothetical protein